MRKSLNKSVFLISLLILINLNSYSQTYYAVTDTNGTQTIASNIVTVSHNFILYSLIGSLVCNFGTYSTAANYYNFTPRTFSYSFSSPIFAIRVHFTAFDYDDTIKVKINGNQFNITNANLSHHVPLINPGCQWGTNCTFAANSEICGFNQNQDSVGYVQLDINPGYPINSVDISELVPQPYGNPSGVEFDFLFTPCNASHAALSNTPCPGDSLHLSALAVATTATYTWTGPNNFLDSVQNPVLANMSAADTGWYYVSADTGYCTYTDSVHVGMLPQPQINSITNNSTICTGHNLQLSLITGPGPQHYQWSGPGGYTDTLQNATRNNLSLGDSGYYYISITDTNHCHTLDSTFVTTRQGPNLPQLSNNNPCIGDTLKLFLNNAQSGVTYIWTGPLSFTTSNTNPSIANAQSNRSGFYLCTGYYNNCDLADSMQITVHPNLGPPSASIVVNKDTICAGDTAHFSVSTTNAGSPISYQWRRNGIAVGSNNNTLSSNSLVNTDIITCQITSSSPCQPNNTALSNGITMHVNQQAPPSMYLTQYPATYAPGDTVTFTGYPSNPTGLSFKWKKNGHYIGGISSAAYTTYNLTAEDTICLVAYSSIPCTQPDSVVACKTLTTGVEGLQRKGISIYPNPVENELVIEGADAATVFVYDILSRNIYKGELSYKQIKINTTSWVQGTYLVEIYLQNGFREIRKIVKK